MTETNRPAWKAWVELLRPPNLFTVPGDPAAGVVMAWFLAEQTEYQRGFPLAAMVLSALAALLLYCAGLLANDYFDLDIDRRERPGRPLPSGRVRPRAAMIAAGILALAGIVAAFLASPGPPWTAAIVAVVLAAAIFLYDAGGKKVPVWGLLNMGLCRGLSVMLGAAAAGFEPAAGVPLAVGVTLYIAAVTAVAARETGAARIGLRRFLPVLAMAAWIGLVNAPLLFGLFAVWFPWLVLQIAAIGWTIRCSESLKGDVPPGQVQRTVGRLIRGLLLVQASIASLVAMTYPAGWALMIALLVFWPVSAIVARRFYAS